MMSMDPPHIVVSRLPLYLRALTFLQAEGKRITSSKELAERLGISSAQIRKDLSHFGEFGKQGTGYEISNLVDQLRRILKVNRDWPVVLIGAGDLGHALVHSSLRERGFRIAAIFDNSPDKIGTLMDSMDIQDIARMSDVVLRESFRMAIVAVPPKAAQGVVDALVKAGITAILNYAPITVTVPPEVHVEYMDPVVHLQRMTYYL